MQLHSSLGRPYWRMWTAIATSSLGDGMLNVALPLLALQFTRSPLAISGVVIATMIPVVVAALPFGTLADRLNRRRLLLAIQISRFAALGAFGAAVLFHRDSLPLIYAAAFLLGGLNIGFDVVASASVPSMVGPEDLVRANAHLLNAELTAENLVGQALGGAALALSRSLPFLANAGSFVASAALLNGAIPDSTPESDGTSAWQSLCEGLRWFGGHTVLRLLTAVIASLAFCQGLVYGLLALYARQTLHLSSSAYGLLLAITSIGTIIGGVIAPRLHARMGAAGTIVVAAVIGATAYLVLAATDIPVVAAVALVAQEGIIIIGNTASRSLRQRLVPPEMQGRAASANSLVVMSFIPMGALAGGLLGSAVGLSSTFVLAAIMQMVVLAAAGPKLARRVRTIPADESVPVLDLSSSHEAATAPESLEPPSKQPA